MNMTTAERICKAVGNHILNGLTTNLVAIVTAILAEHDAEQAETNRLLREQLDLERVTVEALRVELAEAQKPVSYAAALVTCDLNRVAAALEAGFVDEAEEGKR